MTIRDITKILSAEVICGEGNLDKEVHNACGSDMMSDVLAFVKDQSVLITGLCNPQVIRTAEMMDIICICFVRGKEPDEAMIELAKEHGFPYFGTTLTLSPYKNAEWLNEIGEKEGDRVGVNYLFSDFKKKGGYHRSIELSKQHGLYRQDFCGCKFSKK